MIIVELYLYYFRVTAPSLSPLLFTSISVYNRKPFYEVVKLPVQLSSYNFICLICLYSLSAILPTLL